MLEFYVKYYKPLFLPFLWHFLEFILMTIETKDKFPTDTLKQLHL